MIRTVTANQLEIGDTILKDDGNVDSYVEDVFVDPDDSRWTWLDDGNSAGFLGSHQKFTIEYFED